MAASTWSSELLPKNENAIMRGLESRRDLHAAVSVYGGRDLVFGILPGKEF
jgi:hypothetical protein